MIDVRHSIPSHGFPCASCHHLPLPGRFRHSERSVWACRRMARVTKHLSQQVGDAVQPSSAGHPANCRGEADGIWLCKCDSRTRLCDGETGAASRKRRAAAAV